MEPTIDAGSSAPRKRRGPVQAIREDLRAALERDPAARNWFEVVLFYPGWHALMMHRVAHLLWRSHLKLPARMLGAFSRFMTGIEIHPAVPIGRGFFIDHGMGVVIGETAEIGDNVTLYHGVTLGGRSLEKTKRHPTVGNNVVVGAGAKILGPVLIGDGARIGAGSVVVKDVPPNSVVVGVPGRVTFRDGAPVHDGIDLEHDNLPDPVVRALQCMLDRVQGLEAEIQRLDGRVKPYDALNAMDPDPRISGNPEDESPA
ncbi:serine O-acetyltransferase [Candidatus Poribacteria bacterium]|nr:serine O-acetyltransferase [Candidatus Poribacteria bacterium]